jgi:hypothetical protein
MQNYTLTNQLGGDKLQSLEDRIAVVERFLFDPSGANNTLAKTLVQQFKLLEARVKMLEQQVAQAGASVPSGDTVSAGDRTPIRGQKSLKDDTLDMILADFHGKARQALAYLPSKKNAQSNTVLGLKLRKE